jgi:hypothetical protein
MNSRCLIVISGVDNIYKEHMSQIKVVYICLTYFFLLILIFNLIVLAPRRIISEQNFIIISIIPKFGSSIDRIE